MKKRKAALKLPASPIEFFGHLPSGSMAGH